jgi:PAP2 superfamily protein
MASSASEAHTAARGAGDGPRGARLSPLARQIALFAGATVAYFAVRALTEGDAGQAWANARAIVRAETALGILWEPGLQRALLEHEWPATLANWVYIYGYWPFLAGVLVWLFLRRRNRYYLLRDALFVSGAIGLVVFALAPVAPPRFGILPMVDTVTEMSRSYRALQPPELINRFAAMPSFHFGWDLIAGVVLLTARPSPPLRLFAVALPIAMGIAVVATANHFVLDVAAGGVVALVGLLASWRLRSLWPATRGPGAPARPPRAPSVDPVHAP